MKLIISEIYDITPKNRDEKKMLLVDRILNSVGPLFEKEIEENQGGLKELKDQKAVVGEELKAIKEELQDQQSELTKETKRKKLLLRIQQLIDAGLTSDTSLRSEVIILLKVIDKLEDDLLDEHIERMIKTISSRFSKKL